jgi:predicted Zn-dependent peptidase
MGLRQWSALLLISAIWLLNLIPIHECWRVRDISKSPPRPRIGKFERHPLLRSSTLNNGLKYLILPTIYPKNSFSAYLEVLSGSASENDNERGLAHFMEHVAFMGATTREELHRIKGSKTNAYTDFHHTVYYTSFPTSSDQKKSALDNSFRMLSSLLREPSVNSDTLTSEKAAVLSEMVHVNTLSHRMGMQRIRDLHADNILSARDPIGDVSDICTWSEHDVLRYQKKTYRPDNAVLYVVGDIDASAVERSIENRFGCISCDRNQIGKVHLNI